MYSDVAFTQERIYKMAFTTRSILADALKPKLAGVLFPHQYNDVLSKLRPRQRGRWSTLLRAIESRLPGKPTLARHGLIDADLDLKYRLLMKRAHRFRSIAQKIKGSIHASEFARELKVLFGAFLDVAIPYVNSLIDALNMKTPIMEFVEYLKLLLEEEEEPSWPLAPEPA